MESTDHENSPESMLLETSKVQQSFFNECEERVSTRAEISTQLLRVLYKVQQEHKMLLDEVCRQELKAMKIVNRQLRQKMNVLGEQNQQLRKMYKDVAQSRNLRKMDCGRSFKQSLENSQQRIAEQFHDHMMRESLASNKSLSRYVPRGTLPIINNENRRESFRTTRNNTKFDMASSIKRTFMSGKASLNNSFYGKRDEPHTVSDNIFLNIMNLMLEEEKQHEVELQQLAEAGIPQCLANQNFLEFEEVESLVKQSEIRIQGLLKLVEFFKANICSVDSQMEQLLKIIDDFTQAKEKIVEIATKSKKLSQYREEKARLEEDTPRNKDKPVKVSEMESIKMFLGLFCQDTAASDLPIVERIRRIDTNKLLVDKRQGKIRELIESIRQGRKKFHQIHEIYLQRIETLEEKIKNHEQA